MIEKVADDDDAAFIAERTIFRPHEIHFPKFDGQNPRAWSNKCEQLFELCPIPENRKVLYASFHLEGSPEIWFRSYYEIKGKVLEWRTFVDDICARFGRDDVLGEYIRLQQSTTVSAYLEEFEELLALVMYEYKLDEKDFVASFLSGLKDEIKFAVQMFNPTTVSEAARLARLKEAAMKPILG